MANENLIRSVSYKAAADLSASQFCAVYVSAADTVALYDYAAGRVPIGVLRNKPDAVGRPAEVQVSGTGQVKLGGTVAAGQRIAPTASGLWIACPGGWTAWGVATEGGVAGDIVEAAIFCEGGGSYTLSP